MRKFHPENWRMKCFLFTWISVWQKLDQGNHRIIVKSFLEKIPFHDGLVWKVGLTGEINLRFQIPSRVNMHCT